MLSHDDPYDPFGDQQVKEHKDMAHTVTLEGNGKGEDVHSSSDCEPLEMVQGLTIAVPMSVVQTNEMDATDTMMVVVVVVGMRDDGDNEMVFGVQNRHLVGQQHMEEDIHRGHTWRHEVGRTLLQALGESVVRNVDGEGNHHQKVVVVVASVSETMWKIEKIECVVNLWLL